MNLLSYSTGRGNAVLLPEKVREDLCSFAYWSGLWSGVERVMLVALLSPVKEEWSCLAGSKPAAMRTDTVTPERSRAIIHSTRIIKEIWAWASCVAHRWAAALFLRRLANSEDENEQAGRKQLPNEENGSEDNVASVSKFTLKVSLIRDVVPVIVKGLDFIILRQKQHSKIVACPAREEQDDTCPQHRSPAKPLTAQIRGGGARGST